MRDDQRQLAEALRLAFSGQPVETEWRSLAGETDVYCPRVDIAVGPFATDRRLEAEYDQLFVDHAEILRELHRGFARNVRTLRADDRVPPLETMSRKNKNARCFLAIELEGSGSRKHIMGSALNAVALGRFGIDVGCNERELRVLLRMRRYLLYLASLGKNTLNVDNLLVVTPEQFLDALAGV